MEPATSPLHISQVSHQISRRSLYQLIARRLAKAGTLAAVAAGTLSGLATIRFFFPNSAPCRRGRFLAGSIDQFPPGTVDSRWKDTHGLWIVRLPEREGSLLLAVDATCTHLGCQIMWEETAGQFRCPCHGSQFARDGRVISGPATRPLTRYRVTLLNENMVVVDPNTSPDA